MSGKGTPKKIEVTAAKAPGARPTPSPLPVSSSPSVDSVIGVLPSARLLDLCRLFGCEVHDITGGKERLVRKLAGQMTGRLPAVLRELGRDELRAVCRRHGLDPSARARADLQGLVLEAAGLDPRDLSLPPTPAAADYLPVKGQRASAWDWMRAATVGFGALAVPARRCSMSRTAVIAVAGSLYGWTSTASPAQAAAMGTS